MRIPEDIARAQLNMDKNVRSYEEKLGEASLLARKGRRMRYTANIFVNVMRLWSSCVD